MSRNSCLCKWRRDGVSRQNLHGKKNMRNSSRQKTWHSINVTLKFKLHSAKYTSSFTYMNMSIDACGDAPHACMRSDGLLSPPAIRPTWDVANEGESHKHDLLFRKYMYRYMGSQAVRMWSTGTFIFTCTCTSHGYLLFLHDMCMYSKVGSK